MKKPARILVVDDEKQILEVVKAYLEKEGFRVMTAERGKEALARFDLFPPDVVLLDLMLPDISGEAVCRKIRAKSKAPVIMLTAKVDEENIIAGLGMGADDYITKPFSPRELVARVKAALRRDGFSGVSGARIASGALTLDTANRAAEIDNKRLPLTTDEYKLLELFMTNPGKIFTREEIIGKTKNADFDGYERAVDTHIKNLRQKIGDNARGGSRFIETVYGMGYRFAGIIND
ncbi:MAG: response regulator transcription factor [Spirochaetaceae bacterium]|jgi:DNA-binding response OmpR family regulator|nr:response regulator transcription factor [Spirochaetaceae bacterium]